MPYYIQAFKALCAELTDTSFIDSEVAGLKQECEIVAKLMEGIIAENAQNAQDQAEYVKRYNELVSRFEAARGRLEALESEKRERLAKQTQVQRFIAILNGWEGLLEKFDEHSWNVLVEHITVFVDRTMRVKFRDGTEIAL